MIKHGLFRGLCFQLTTLVELDSIIMFLPSRSNSLDEVNSRALTIVNNSASFESLISAGLPFFYDHEEPYQYQKDQVYQKKKFIHIPF
jgi:hypothetical protein